MKDELLFDYVDGENIHDLEDKLEHFEGALADHQKNGTTHWWQSEFVSTDTLVRDEIAQEMQEMGAWRGDLEEKVEKDKKYNIFVDGDKGTTKDGHNYRAVEDDQDYSQYLKVFYGDGKYFRIYYDSRVTGGKAGGYDPREIETNDPKAEKVFADLPDNFFKKYGSEGEHGIEDIIDMIKKEDIKEEYEAGEMVRYFLKQDFTKMSKEKASSIVGHIADDVFPNYDMHEDPLDGALDVLHDMIDLEGSGYKYSPHDGHYIEDIFMLSDEDYEDLPKIQKMVQKEYMKRLKDTELMKDEPRKDSQGELPGVNVMQGESISEATLGAVHGSLKTSYQPLDNVKLVVKHSKPVNEEVRGARSRNISKIFIQANEERFLFPSKNLQGARAMARHIYNGGVMHDSIGESIVQMCKDFGTLKEFIRHVNKKGLINEDNQEYVTLARQQMDNIRTAFKRVAGVKTYSKAIESITDESNIDIVTEVNLEDHFTETHFDDKVGNAHETLSKLVNRKNAFEQYIMNAIENENFANAKELIQEEPIEFENAHQRLGYQVGQLSSCVKDSKLANYLGGIETNYSTGGQLDAMEYRAVKASLLSAQRPQQPVMATEMSLAESIKYQKFIESFDVEV